MAKFNTGQSFADGDQVTGAKLNNIVGLLDIYSGVIADQTAIAATVSTADLLLIADTDAGSSGAANKVTIQKLLNDTLTGGTFTNANIAEQLTYGTATGNRTVSTNAVITNGTISNATLGTTTGTLATITNLTAGTTTSTAANITNGTVQTLTASTATISVGTYSGLINNSTGTFSGAINSTLGTIATLNSTNISSTTGTIGNLSTTLAGDFTISQGTGTLGTTGVTAGTYGTSTAVPRIVVDSKGRISSVSTAAISSGKVLQVTRSTTASVVTCGTTIPWDDTIPQITEGNEVLTITISPISATSVIYLKFDASGVASQAVVNSGTVAFFKDSTADAIYATAIPFWTASAYGIKLNGSYSELSSSTTSRIYRVRVGSDAGTIYVNGNNAGARRYGGVSISHFEAWEVEP